MRSSRWLPLLAVTTLGLGSCGSNLTSDTDNLAANKAKVEAIVDCFPNLWRFVNGLVVITDTWKMNGGTEPDPVGLATTVNGDGSLTVTLGVGTTTLSMDINFYGPSGARQDLSSVVTTPTTLGAKIDAAATELRTQFGAGEKFIHAVYSITGGGISASGEAISALIGGSTGQNEIASLRTSLAAVTTGLPAVDSSVITDSSSSPACTLTFTIEDLATDAEPGQEYPSGTMTVTVFDGTTSVTTNVVFDQTKNARITVDGLTGGFDFDLEALTLRATF
jgi:hypothetical protein